MSTMVAPQVSSGLVVEPHQLFNWINNMFPILPLAFRPNQGSQHQRPQLRNTATLDIALESQLDASALRASVQAACAAHRRSVGERIAVILCDNVVEMDRIDGLLAGQSPMSLDGIRELHLVNFQSFCESYHLCSGMFDDPVRSDSDGIPSSLQRRRLQIYYASEVVPQLLYLGDFENGQNKEQLQALHISHVIDATNAQTSEQSAKDLGLQYLAVNVEDRSDANITQFFYGVVQFVKRALGTPPPDGTSHVLRPPRILFHCRAGWSRSPTLLMVCMIELFHHSLESALTAVLKSRPNVCPNPGFCTALIDFERDRLSCASSDETDGQLLSFATKHDFMKHVAKLNIMWSPPMTEETDFDRMPIAASACPRFFSDDGTDPAAVEAALEARLREAGAFATAEANCQPVTAKKPFLRRGSKPTLK
jgi:dual specificity phosphatase 3